MPHTYTSLTNHIVFATKERRSLIDETLEARLFPYLGGIIRDLGGHLLAVNGGVDHLHMLTVVPPTIAVSDLLRKVKGCSSLWIHSTFPERWRFEWQRGFGAFSVSESQIPRVRAYIDGQKEHHRAVSFHDEFVALLQSYGFSPEDRFLWS